MIMGHFFGRRRPFAVIACGKAATDMKLDASFLQTLGNCSGFTTRVDWYAQSPSSASL